MKIKDSFWLGLLIGAASFGLFFLLLSLINWESLGVFAKRAPYLLAFIPAGEMESRQDGKRCVGCHNRRNAVGLLPC